MPSCSGRLAGPDWLLPQARQAPGRLVAGWLASAPLHARLALAGLPAWPDDLLSRWLPARRADPNAWPLRSVRDRCMTALAGRARNHAGATLAWWMWALARQPRLGRGQRRKKPPRPARRAPTAADARADRAAPLAGRNPAPAPGGAAAEHPPRHPPDHRGPVAIAGWHAVCCCRCSWRSTTRRRLPKDFCPARFAGHEAGTHPHWLPFDLDSRVCLGQHQAMMELTVLAALLAQRLQLAHRRRPASPAAAVAGVVPAGCAVAGYPPTHWAGVAYKSLTGFVDPTWPAVFSPPRTRSTKPARRRRFRQAGQSFDDVQARRFIAPLAAVVKAGNLVH